MSEEIKNKEPELPSFIKAAPELLPVWDWWVKEGKSTLMMLVVAGIAVAGFYGVRNWLRVRDANANNALVSAFAVDELEQAAAKYGSTKAGYAIRLRLAKGYYDAERYQEALDTYEKLVDGNAAFRDIAMVGRAFALEGLGKIDDAAKAFADYAGDEANKTSYLLLTAKLGIARCKALKGDKEGAAKDFAALKAAATDEVAKNRIERMADAIKRHDPKRAARSLFDAANAAAAEVDAAAKPEAAKPAAPAPAAKPEAAKPAAPAPAAKPEAAKPAAPAPAAKPAA